MNKFFSGLSKGISDYGPALRFLFKHNLGWFLLAPVILNLALFFGGIAAISSFSDYLEAEILDAVSLKDATFFGAQVLSWLLAGAVWLILKIAFFFIFAYTGGYIILIVMSPVLAFLSEKTEQILTGKEYPFDIQQLMRDVVRGVLIALRNLFVELLIAFALFIAGLLPIINWVIVPITPIILLFVAAYFYGFSFTDYVNERQKLSLKESVQYMKKNKGTITGNGMPFALILLVPFFGLTLSGFLAIIGVVASVISVKDINKQDSNDIQAQELIPHE